MNFETFWTAIAPYAQGFIGLTVAGVPIGFIIWAIVKKLIAKTAAKLLAGSSAEKIAQEVAKQVAHTDVGIDLTAITEEQLNEIKLLFMRQMEAVAKTLDENVKLQALTVKAMTASEVVSEETKAEMIAAVEEQGMKTENARRKRVVVKLEPIRIEEDQETASGGFVNFGGDV